MAWGQSQSRLALEDAIVAHFGLAALRKFSTHPGAVVYRGSYGERDVAVKVYEKGDIFLRESECLMLLNRKNVPVPLVVDSGVVGGVPVLLQEWWPCHPLDDTFSTLSVDRQRRLVRQAGALLATVDFALSPGELAQARFWHRFAFSRMADFSWPRYLKAQLEKWCGRIVLTPSDGEAHLDLSLASIRDRVTGLPDPQRPTLLHCDYGFRNLLLNVEQDSLCGVIDFGTCLMGDPMYDLAKLTWVDIDLDNAELQEQFIAGWERAAGWSVDRRRLALYQAIHAVAAMSWVDSRVEQSEGDAAFRQRAAYVLSERTQPKHSIDNSASPNRVIPRNEGSRPRPRTYASETRFRAARDSE